MSSMKAVLQRSGDNRIIKVDVDCNYSGYFDHAIISFKCEDVKLDVLSTSAGSINDGSININGLANFISFVEYCPRHGEIECLIGYYSKKELINHESLTFVFDNNKIINDSLVSPSNLRTVNIPFADRLVDFKETLFRTKSSWNAEMKILDDILISFLSVGNNAVLLSFGEESEEVLASDYIFTADPPIRTIHIPRDFFQSRRDRYSTKCKLGIFELVIPDFISVKNLYYKVPICETISLSEFWKKK